MQTWNIPSVVCFSIFFHHHQLFSEEKLPCFACDLFITFTVGTFSADPPRFLVVFVFAESDCSPELTVDTLDRDLLLPKKLSRGNDFLERTMLCKKLRRKHVDGFNCLLLISRRFSWPA